MRQEITTCCLLMCTVGTFAKKMNVKNMWSRELLQLDSKYDISFHCWRPNMTLSVFMLLIHSSQKSIKATLKVNWVHQPKRSNLKRLKLQFCLSLCSGSGFLLFMDLSGCASFVSVLVGACLCSQVQFRMSMCSRQGSVVFCINGFAYGTGKN